MNDRNAEKHRKEGRPARPMSTVGQQRIKVGESRRKKEQVACYLASALSPPAAVGFA